ncbi:MAG: PAS domain S-box protein [Bacteroidetes bacterium]|nr:PAS domain S-box protein [Bacteroidota bacterium]
MDDKQDSILLNFTTPENVYQAIIESLPHIVWVADSEGQVTYVNKAWHDLTGYSFEESLSTGWAVAIHPKDAPELLQKWENVYENGEAYQGECRFASDG